MRWETERLVTHIIKALDSLQADVHKLAKSVSENHNPQSGPDEPQPRQAIETNISLPPAIGAYYDAEQRERPSHNKWRWTERCIALLAFLTAAALAILTYKTLCQVKR